MVQLGQVELVAETKNTECRLTVCNKGEVFGDVPLFADKARFLTASATQDSRILRVDKKTFMTQLSLDPSFALQTIERLARRVYELDHDLLRLMEDRSQPDPLTGLPGYDSADEMLEREVEISKRLRQTLAFVVIDRRSSGDCQHRSIILPQYRH